MMRGGWEHPVDLNLVYFTGKPKGTHILLEWESVNEIGLEFYQLEKSGDGKRFELLANFTAQGSGHNYAFPDESPQNGVNFYRLSAYNEEGELEGEENLAVLFGRDQFEILTAVDQCKTKYRNPQ